MLFSRDITSLADMRNAARHIVEFTKEKTYEEYLASDMLQAAVERKIEIMGEAARRISKEFKSAHPEISSQAITVQRHIVAHDYDIVRHEKIWHVVATHAPRLIEKIEQILPPPPPIK